VHNHAYCVSMTYKISTPIISQKISQWG